MTTRPPSGPVRRAAHRGLSRAMGALARRRSWPGVSSPDGSVLREARVRRLVVPAVSRPDASVLVVAPEGEDEDLPVVYLLHGYPDAPQAPLAAGLARAVRGARAGGSTLWPPFVLVVPDGTRWGRGDHEWADAADGVDLVESWLVEDVVPAVEGDRPRSASRRTLAGFSMGGYGALNVGLRHPEVFASIACFSGYGLADDPEGVFGGDQDLLAANSPLLLASDATPRPAAGLRVALVETAREPSLIAGQGAAMAAALRAGGAEVMERHVRGHHAWRCVARLWPSVLTWVSASW